MPFIVFILLYYSFKTFQSLKLAYVASAKEEEGRRRKARKGISLPSQIALPFPSFPLPFRRLAPKLSQNTL